MSPLYDFSCDCGQIEERLFKIEQCPDAISCKGCGGMSEKILSFGHGGIKTDTPKWIDHHLRGALQDTDLIATGLEQPIETRQELKKHLKENNLVATG